MIYQIGDPIKSDQAMRLAIEVAKKGRGFVSPNPVVGCVVVDANHNFLAADAHLKFGGPHAEINALNQIEDRQKLKGATLYVTLEPCAHQGKTGSCAEFISRLPIRKVFYGTLDPNPLVAGKGVEILRSHQKLVSHFDEYDQDCKELCEQFIFHIQTGLPFVSLKVATSFDGKMALSDGQSQWITCDESRLHSRRLRAHYDATLIGTGTLKYDNPTLDFRGTAFEGQKKNKIVILDANGSAAENFKEHNVFKTHGSKNIFVLTREEHRQKWSKNLVHLIPWEASEQGWNLALKNLVQKGIYSLFIEGGSYAYGQALNFKILNKIYLFQSPQILGDGISWTQYFKVTELGLAPRLSRWQSVSLGTDLLHAAYFDRPLKLKL